MTVDTLHYLFATGAIDGQTYVYAEHLEGGNSWVRLKRVPELVALVKRPCDASVESSSPSAAKVQQNKSSDERAYGELYPRTAPAQTHSATGGGSHMLPVGAAPSQAASIPSQAINPAAQTAAPIVVPPPQAPAIQPPEQLEPLYHHFASAPAKQPPCPAPAPAKAKRSWFGFGPRRESAKTPQTTANGASSSSFGQPLASVPRDATSGAPLILCQLRSMLFEAQGHTVEGIFRVSPGPTALSDARRHAHAGHVSKVEDPESLAQLIKEWFREWPQSLLPRPLPRPLSRHPSHTPP